MKKLSETQVLRLLKARVTASGSQRAFCQEYGVAEAIVSDVMKGRRPLGGKLLEVLGLVRSVTVVYEWARGAKK